MRPVRVGGALYSGNLQAGFHTYRFGKFHKFSNRNLAILVSISKCESRRILKNLVITTQARFFIRLIEKHLRRHSPLSILEFKNEIVCEKAGLTGVLVHQCDKTLQVLLQGLKRS